MTDNDRNLKIIENLRRMAQERVSTPDKFREWMRKVHGDNYRELTGDDAEKMIVLLKLVGHYTYTNNQKTSTYFYHYNEKEYRITYGFDEPLVEEVLSHDL